MARKQYNTIPDDFEEVVKNADSLFAELLIRYYYSGAKKHLTRVNYAGKLRGIKDEVKNDKLYIRKRSSENTQMHQTRNRQKNLAGNH